MTKELKELALNMSKRKFPETQPGYYYTGLIIDHLLNDEHTMMESLQMLEDFYKEHMGYELTLVIDTNGCINVVTQKIEIQKEISISENDRTNYHC